MNEILMGWLRWFFLLPGNIVFWQVTTWIATLVALFLGLVYLYFRWQLSLLRLKRVSQVRKSQRKLIESGMSWDKVLSNSQGGKAQKEAILELAEKDILELREKRKLLEENNFSTIKEFNKVSNRIVKLKKNFAFHVYPLVRAGIVVPIDIMDSIYTKTIEEMKAKKSGSKRLIEKTEKVPSKN